MDKDRRTLIESINISGQKLPINKDDIWRILDYLAQGRELNRERNLALFSVAIDSGLRGVDILKLKVRQVSDCFGQAYSDFRIIQQKKIRKDRKIVIEDVTVDCVLEPLAQERVTAWIKAGNLKPNDYLFTAHHPQWKGKKPLSTNLFRRMIKKWIMAIGVDSARYSGHSTRKSYAQYLWERGVPLSVISQKLGHSSERTTRIYLNISFQEVKEAVRRNPILPKTLNVPDKPKNN